MGGYLVTYDLNKEIHRPNITGEIHKFDGWAKLSESSYAIRTNLSPNQIYDKLKPMIDSNDFIYVITLRSPYRGFGNKEVNEWLSQNLF